MTQQPPGAPDPRAMLREYVLHDHDGKAHQYMTVLHGATDGLGIVMVLLSMAGGPGGQLVRGAMKHYLEHGGFEFDKGAEEMLTIVDWGAVGNDLAAMMIRRDAKPLIRAMLKNTHRDGKQLADSLVFDAAYQANYFELWAALWEVLKVNNFLSPPATLQDSMKRAADALIPKTEPDNGSPSGPLDPE